MKVTNLNWNIYCTLTEVFLYLTEVFLTLTEVFPCSFLSCKANARVKLAKTGHGPHSSTLAVICVVRLLFVLFYVLFVCKCVLPPGDNPIAVNKYIISYTFAPKSTPHLNSSMLLHNLLLSRVPSFFFFFFFFSGAAARVALWPLYYFASRCSRPLLTFSVLLHSVATKSPS